jgi:hypothetical protein
MAYLRGLGDVRHTDWLPASDPGCIGRRSFDVSCMISA